LVLPPTYKAGQKLPMILLIYGGGLGSRSLEEFGGFGSDALYNMQILALQGYAVLYPDIPLRAGHPMRDIYTNTTEAADAAIAQGYADPDRLAVMGQSFGAYSVLSTIVQTTRFKAAVMTAAINDPDLITTLLSITPAGQEYLLGFDFFEHGQGNMGVSLWEDPQVYIRNSPIYGFDKITTPLLIGGGADDHSLTGALQTFSALRRLGKPVEYRLYQGERHVIQGKANVTDFLERRADFLARYLNVARDSSGTVVMDGDHAKAGE
jgi:dipeptidyl aminopeptidase/acylaminoacyl peptidase